MKILSINPKPMDQIWSTMEKAKQEIQREEDEKIFHELIKACMNAQGVLVLYASTEEPL